MAFLRAVAALALGFLLACGAGAGSRLPPPAPQGPAPVQQAAHFGLPPEALATLTYIREHHAAPPGYEGGRRFGNYEGRLPDHDSSGRRITYQEWDVHPRLAHRNRGAERLVTGSDGRAWFTGDHYGHFTEAGEAP